MCLSPTPDEEFFGKVLFYLLLYQVSITGIQSMKLLEPVNIFLTILNHSLGRNTLRIAICMGVLIGRDGEGVIAERF